MPGTEEKITDAELEVLRVLWAAGEPCTVGQVKSALADQSWNGETVKTLLRRLCQKGAVAQEKRGVYYYRPLVDQKTLGRYRTQRVIDKLYAGSARSMVAALVEHHQSGSQDVEDLHNMFQELWNRKEE